MAPDPTTIPFVLARLDTLKLFFQDVYNDSHIQAFNASAVSCDDARTKLSGSLMGRNVLDVVAMLQRLMDDLDKFFFSHGTAKTAFHARWHYVYYNERRIDLVFILGRLPSVLRELPATPAPSPAMAASAEDFSPHRPSPDARPSNGPPPAPVPITNYHSRLYGGSPEHPQKTPAVYPAAPSPYSAPPGHRHPDHRHKTPAVYPDEEDEDENYMPLCDSPPEGYQHRAHIPSRAHTPHPRQTGAYALRSMERSHTPSASDRARTPVAYAPGAAHPLGRAHTAPISAVPQYMQYGPSPQRYATAPIPGHLAAQYARPASTRPYHP